MFFQLNVHIQEQKRKNEKKYFDYLWLILLFLSLVCSLFACILYRGNNGLAKKAETISYWVNNFNTINANYQELNKEKSEIISKVDIENKSAIFQYTLLRDTKSLMELTSCDVQSINPGKNYKDGIFNVIDYKIAVTGTYKNLFFFLYNLESLVKGYRIQSLNLSMAKTAKDTTGNLVSAQIMVSDYTLVEKDQKSLFYDNSKDNFHPIAVLEMTRSLINYYYMYLFENNKIKSQSFDINVFLDFLSFFGF